MQLRFQGTLLSLSSLTTPPSADDSESSLDLGEEEELFSEGKQLKDATESEDGPDWMFEDGETRSEDTDYVFCPAVHRSQLLRLFTKHFCQHPLLPERGGESLSQEVIRERAVEEMYRFCLQRGLAEVWGYFWASWYSPRKWELWARSTSPLLSRLRTTMGVENFWRQLKHNTLKFLTRPRIDQLIFILRTIVVPNYISRGHALEPTYRLGRAKALTTFQEYFKSHWKELLGRPITDHDYHTDILSWTCHCGQQKYNPYLLCKHLVQAIGKPPINFWSEVCRRRTLPIYHHPSFFKDMTSYCDPDDGTITEGDDQVYLGDTKVLASREWQDFEGGIPSILGKRARSRSVAASSSHASDMEDTIYNPYDSDDEEMVRLI